MMKIKKAMDSIKEVVIGAMRGSLPF